MRGRNPTIISGPAAWRGAISRSRRAAGPVATLAGAVWATCAVAGAMIFLAAGCGDRLIAFASWVLK